MPRLSSALIVLAVLGTSSVRADDTAPAPFTGNLALTSDYMYRGLSQTWGLPALQGGADYAAANGFAAGAWASRTGQRSYPGAAMELDLYASYGGAITPDWSWRAGLYGYVYPHSNLDRARPRLPARSFNTLEANLALSWKWLTLKYNRTLTDYFAADVEEGYAGNSRGTQYLQLDAAIPLRGTWSLALHAARTHMPHALLAPVPGGARNPDYNDYGITLKDQLSPHWSLSGGITRATNAAFYAHTPALTTPGAVGNIGGTRGFVMVQTTF